MASICGVNQSMAELFVCLSLYLKLLVWNGVSPYSITVPEFRIWSCFQSQLPSTVLPGRQQFMSPIICPWLSGRRGVQRNQITIPSLPFAPTILRIWVWFSRCYVNLYLSLCFYVHLSAIQIKIKFKETKMENRWGGKERRKRETGRDKGSWESNRERMRI